MERKDENKDFGYSKAVSAQQQSDSEESDTDRLWIDLKESASSSDEKIIKPEEENDNEVDRTGEQVTAPEERKKKSFKSFQSRTSDFTKRGLHFKSSDPTFNKPLPVKRPLLVRPNPLNYGCKCLKPLNPEGDRDEHLLIYKDEDYFRCHICGKPFKRPTQLIRHASTDDSKKGFKCESCKRHFTTFKKLKEHILRSDKLSQRSEKRCKCDLCNKSQCSNYDLQEHYKNVHSINKKYPCNFQDKKALTEHTFLHKSDRPFKCDICDRAFNFKSNLRDHKRTHIDKKLYLCEICGISFKTDHSRKAHVKIFHPDEKRVKCNFCRSSFTTKKQLDAHIFIHHGNEAVTCDLCGKIFLGDSKLEQHKKESHVNDPRLSCIICSKYFRNSLFLQQHIIKKHCGF